MNLKLLTGVIVSTAFLLPGSASGQTADFNIVPQPLQADVTNDAPFILNGKTSIVVATSNNDLKRNATLLASYIEQTTGVRPTVGKQGKDATAIVLSIDKTISNAEGYKLDVDAKRISIAGASAAGVFYGIQTLRKSLPVVSGKASQVTIPCAHIVDAPRFSYRGTHLDVSRHFVSTDEIRQFIDILALHNINRFHWHLTDDQGWRIEIKKYPLLTEVGSKRTQTVIGHNTGKYDGKPYGGFYTQEDVKEVLAYAAERYVRVIPEIDVPGHSLAALVAYPDLACMKAPSAVGVGNKFYGEDENTLCVGKDATFEFMDKVLTEVAALFPDEYIHIGGDECFKGFWHKCPRCQARMKAENLKNENELQSYFIHRMESILKEKGKKLIGWDEIIDGGLAPDATVMSWRGMEGGIKSAKAGHHVIMTPTEHCYIDLWQGEPSVEPDTYSMCRLKDSYSFNPVPDSVPAEMILGGQGNLWAESVPTFRHAEYMTWPRGWALAEVLWTGPSKTDWDRFWPRVERHFVRADQAQINYARSMYNAIVTPYYTKDGVLEIKLDSEPGNLDIYYTFDNTDPDNFTPKYEAPLRIPKNATWLRIVTYRDNKPIGKVITLTIKELEKRADNTRHVVGNL